MDIKKLLFPLIFGTLLTVFTVYACLDTFVIPHVYSIVDETSASATPDALLEATAGKETTPKPETTQAPDKGGETPVPSEETDPPATPVTVEDGELAGSYDDGSISINIYTKRIYDTSVYIADIVLTSPEYLKTALAKGSFGRNVTDETSDIAKKANAIFAVNGDYYGSRNTGYVIRNGSLLRSRGARNQEDLVIYADGSFEIINESTISAQDLLNKGAVNVLSFGPGLVIGGEIAVDASDEVGIARESNPRTAIGIVDDLHYVFIVSDGRTDESAGLSLLQLAEVMKGLGVKNGYNLDGGGSSTMYFNGEIINVPTTSGFSVQERKVSDIVYIGYN